MLSYRRVLLEAGSGRSRDTSQNGLGARPNPTKPSINQSIHQLRSLHLGINTFEANLSEDPGRGPFF